MSGTSLDGVDAALVDFSTQKPVLVYFQTYSLPEPLKQRILDCCDPEKSNIALTCSLNAELGYLFAKAAKSCCLEAGVSLEEVACIASHGQTVYHIPTAEGDLIPSTLQLGEPAIIAYETGAQVVSSFRGMDMAAGGRGAPLVPYTEYLLYRCNKGRALQNIGGIGNVTVLPPDCGLNEVFAFDTGPGNMVSDALMRRLYNLPYDRDGLVAASGKADRAIVERWLSLPYFKTPPPKATGRELFGEQFVDALMREYPLLSPEDRLATALLFTAESIAQSYRDHVFPHCKVEELIVSGGGSHNRTLLHLIAKALPECRVMTQEDLGFSSDAKEAVAFAMLAYETLGNRPGNLCGATGAREQVILGNITPAPQKQP